MTEEIKYILDKFDEVLENYELDKKLGQMSVDSICHLFPSEIITIKDYIQQKESMIKEVREMCEQDIRINNSAKGYSIGISDEAKGVLEIIDKMNKEKSDE